MKKKEAFTLAEVLITMTVLGVVAAIMVPSLVKQNYKRTQVSRMAKAYATLEKAAANIAATTNCVGKDLKCSGLLDLTDDTELRQKFAEYGGFRISKELNTSAFYVKPISYEIRPDGTLGKYLKAFVTTPDSLAYTIQYGTLITYGLEAKYNRKEQKAIFINILTDKKLLYDEEGTLYTKGQLSKNAIIGRNVFQFVIYDNFKVEPMCTVSGSSKWPLSEINKTKYFKQTDLIEYCDPNKSHRENIDYYDSCTCRIIHDGWKMKY